MFTPHESFPKILSKFALDSVPGLQLGLASPQWRESYACLGLGAENGPSCLLCVVSVLPVGGAISWFPPHAKVGVIIPQTELGARHRGPHVRWRGHAGTFPLGELVLGSLGPWQSFWLREHLAGLPIKCVLALATAQRPRLFPPLPASPRLFLGGALGSRGPGAGGQCGREPLHRPLVPLARARRDLGIILAIGLGFHCQNKPVLVVTPRCQRDDEPGALPTFSGSQTNRPQLFASV